MFALDALTMVIPLVPLRVLVMLDRIFTSTLSAGILRATWRATCRIKRAVSKLPESGDSEGQFSFLVQDFK